jgi:hypothetical protein
MTEFFQMSSINPPECRFPSLGVSQSGLRELLPQLPQLLTVTPFFPLPIRHRPYEAAQLKASES